MRAILLVPLLLALVPAQARGQQARSVFIVRVHVTDTAAAPVAEAHGTVLSGLHTVVAAGVTNAAGERAFVLPATSGGYELVVRKIGFEPFRQYFTGDEGDTIAVRVRLTRATQVLDEVRVAGERDRRRESYHIDADAITASAARLGDALDIVLKLRPDMIWGRAGRPAHVARSVATDGTRKPKGLRLGECPPLSQVWINGVRAQFPRSTARSLGPRDPHSPIGQLPLGVVAILSSIRPEHVAEMVFIECGDLSAAKPRSDNALFVVLKPGIGYNSRLGSYVVSALEEQPE